MPLSVVLQTATGEKTVQCHRIIARLGAIPPRKFVESIGISFRTTAPMPFPS